MLAFLVPISNSFPLPLSTEVSRLNSYIDKPEAMDGLFWPMKPKQEMLLEISEKVFAFLIKYIVSSAFILYPVFLYLAWNKDVMSGALAATT